MKLQFTHIIPPTSGIADPATKKWADRIVQFLDDTFRKVASIPFNRSESLSITSTGSADTTFTVTHHIGRVPTGYIVNYIDKAAVVYCDSTDLGNWSTTQIKLKCDTANTKVKIVVF